jgi:hypothetical protein
MEMEMKLQKKIVLFLLALGMSFGAASTFAAPGCKIDGQKWLCKYTYEGKSYDCRCKYPWENTYYNGAL